MSLAEQAQEFDFCLVPILYLVPGGKWACGVAP
jgi:hypothetical protein